MIELHLAASTSPYLSKILSAWSTSRGDQPLNFTSTTCVEFDRLGDGLIVFSGLGDSVDDAFGQPRLDLFSVVVSHSCVFRLVIPLDQLFPLCVAPRPTCVFVFVSSVLQKMVFPGEKKTGRGTGGRYGDIFLFLTLLVT